MKYIVERSGRYVTEVKQVVEVEADSPEEAGEKAYEDEDGVRLISGDKEYEWCLCDDADVSIPLPSEEYYRRQQSAMAAYLAPVFEDLKRQVPTR